MATTKAVKKSVVKTPVKKLVPKTLKAKPKSKVPTAKKTIKPSVKNGIGSKSKSVDGKEKVFGFPIRRTVIQNGWLEVYATSREEALGFAQEMLEFGYSDKGLGWKNNETVEHAFILNL